MGSAQGDTFDQLQSRIRQLIERFEEEKKTNELLSRERSELKEQVRLEEERLRDLQEKYKSADRIERRRTRCKNEGEQNGAGNR